MNSRPTPLCRQWVLPRFPSEVMLRGKITLAVSLLALPVFVRAPETIAGLSVVRYTETTCAQ